MPTSLTFAPHGADRQGLIYGYAFAPHAAPMPVDCAGALETLANEAATRAGSFVWLHFNLSHAGALQWLRANTRLSDDFLDALQGGSRSTRIERDGDSLFAVVNDVTFDFAFEASDVATLWLNVDRHVVISARTHPLRSIDRLRAAVRAGETMASPVALLDHLFHDQADELQRIAHATNERVDDAEDALLAGRLPQRVGELPRLRRLMVRLQRLMAPDPGALLRTLAHPPPWLTAADVQRLREASDEFHSVLRDIAALQERIKLLQEEASAHVAEQNNRTLYLLTMVTVLALPINLVAGLLGMNVGGVPLSSHANGFWLVVALVLAVTLALGWYLSRRLAPRRS